MWKKCFSSVMTVVQKSRDFPLQRVLAASLTIQREKNDCGSALSSVQFEKVFKAACVQFADLSLQPLDILAACGGGICSPCIGQQVENLLKGGQNQGLPRGIASALVAASYGPGLPRV